MKLLDYMTREKLTLKHLAERLDMPVSTVHGYLHDDRRPSVAAISKIIEKTDGAVTVGDLRPELAAKASVRTASEPARAV